MLKTTYSKKWPCPKPDVDSKGGFNYLADTVQLCHVHLTALVRWKTGQSSRVLRSAHLEDFLDDRFTIVEQARWEWVRAPPSEQRKTGRVYDVQVLLLRVHNR